MKENEGRWGNSNGSIYVGSPTIPAGLLISLAVSIIASRLTVYAAIITAHCYFSTQSSTQLMVLEKETR